MQVGSPTSLQAVVNFAIPIQNQEDIMSHAGFSECMVDLAERTVHDSFYNLHLVSHPTKHHNLETLYTSMNDFFEQSRRIYTRLSADSSRLIVPIQCTGGNHRSTTVMLAMSKYLSWQPNMVTAACAFYSCLGGLTWSKHVGVCWN